MNITKVLTFYRNQPFDITAEYADPDMLPIGTNPVLGKYHLAVPVASENHKVKVKARLTLHGTFQIESAHIVEIEEYDEVVKEKVDVTMKPESAEGESAETPQGEPEEPAAPEFVEVIKKKKREKKTEIKLSTSHTNGLPVEALAKAIDSESGMIAADREAKERDNSRNDLESYIYDAREKLTGGVWSEYTTNEQEKDALMEEITKTEDWLYDRFEDGTKVEFVEKLIEIQGIISVVKNRYDEVIRKEEEAKEAQRAAEKAAQDEAAAAAAAAAAASTAETSEAKEDVNMESTKMDECD
jgi:hypothetical protein